MDASTQPSVPPQSSNPRHSHKGLLAIAPTQHSIESRTFELIGVISDQLRLHGITYKVATDVFFPCNSLPVKPNAQVKVQLRRKKGVQFFMIFSIFFNQICLSFSAAELNSPPGAYSTLSDIANYLNGICSLGKFYLNFTGRSCLVAFEDLQDYSGFVGDLGKPLWIWVKLLTKQFEGDLQSLLLPCLRRSRESLAVVSVLAETKSVLRSVGFPNFKEKFKDNSIDYTFGIVGIEGNQIIPVLLQIFADKVALRVRHSQKLPTLSEDDSVLEKLLVSLNSSSEGRSFKSGNLLFTEFVNTQIRLDNWRQSLTAFVKVGVRSFCKTRHRVVQLVEDLYESLRATQSDVTASTESFASSQDSN
jgi:hypothetical protein